ncbi:hypothetical protein [Lysinibacillus xylanilyticus]
MNGPSITQGTAAKNGEFVQDISKVTGVTRATRYNIIKREKTTSDSN